MKFRLLKGLSLFGLFHKLTFIGKVEMRFFTDANAYGEHGRINVTSPVNNLYDQSIPFVFVGITTPPKLNEEVLCHVFEEARRQGYNPHFLEQYGMRTEPRALNKGTPIIHHAEGA